MIRATSFFPDPNTADTTGLVAVTDRINADLLLDAYSHGIFPWTDNPVRWYSPDPRAVFLRDRIRVPKKMGKAIRRHGFVVTFDQDFEQVIEGCRSAHMREGTWITPNFIKAYRELHQLGHAHSVEVWQRGQLVGGLYGIQIGGMFAGESMFYRVSNAAKVAFTYLVENLQRTGNLLFDAQVLNAFTVQLGAVLVRRIDFVRALPHALAAGSIHTDRRWPSPPPPLASMQPPN